MVHKVGEPDRTVNHKTQMKQSPQFHVGIDVGASALVVALCCAGQNASVQTYPNTAAAHRRLIKAITARGASARVILEATGVYSLRLALALHAAERVEVMVANPRTIKDYQRARLCRAKTDRVDARGLLDFLGRMEFVPWTPPAPEVLALQQLSRRLCALKAEIVREQARRHAIAFTPDPGAVIAHDVDLNLAHLRRRIKALEAAAADLLAAHASLREAAARLRSTPGIAATSAVRLLGELLVLPPHLKAPQWVAQAGLDPRPVESGTSLHKPRRITKTGNHYLRCALYMPALVAIQRDAHVRACYQALLARGKRPKQAIVAIMRKLLHALWGMLHHQTDFNPQLFYSLPTAHV